MHLPPPDPFPASRSLPEEPGLCARLDSVVFAPELDAPADRPFAFVYHITIANGSGRAVTVKGRKWVVKDLARGVCHVIEGDGVVGRCPRLEPGEAFSYHSYHVVAADSRAEGAYLACDDAGRALVVRLPPFELSVPA